MIVDAHVHAWARWPYAPPVPDPATRGGYESLLYEMDAAGVERAVVVSAAIDHNTDNNDYVAAAVAASPDRLSQFIDVDSRWTGTYHRPGAAARLAGLCDRIRPIGVSHYLGRDNDGWLCSDDGLAFFAEAGRRGLAVSLAATPAWFADICRVAASIPATPILLNHLALVMKHPEGAGGGLALVGRGSGQPNLVVKVSGYYYGSARPWAYPFTDRIEIVRAFYETWGPDRMTWASDYPAAAAHITYRQSLELLREHASFIDPRDLPQILGATMTRLVDAAGSALR